MDAAVMLLKGLGFGILMGACTAAVLLTVFPPH